MGKEKDDAMVDRSVLQGKNIFCPECFWAGKEGELVLEGENFVCPECGNINTEERKYD